MPGENRITITTLVENTVTAGITPLMAEHGLSFYIESDTQKILFDTGQGLSILGNATALGIDLSKIDTLILSHAHFDHGGGIKKVIQCNRDFTLVAHPEVFSEKLVARDGNFVSIGIQQDMDIIKNSGVTLELGKDPFEIASTIAEFAKDKGFDLIFTGMQSQDRGSAQVGVLVAEMLGVPMTAEVGGALAGIIGYVISRWTG